MRTSIVVLCLVAIAIPAIAQSEAVAARRLSITLPPSLPQCQKAGQQLTLSLTTGGTGAFGSSDPIWSVNNNVAYSTSSIWSVALGTAKWIQPNSTGTPVNLPAGTYVYQTKFMTPIDPYLYSSIKIVGQLAADDEIRLELNGQQIASCTPTNGVASTYCFNHATAFPSLGWATFNRVGNPPYLNTLTVKVINSLASSPSALIVNAQLVATCSQCSVPAPPHDPPCYGANC